MSLLVLVSWPRDSFNLGSQGTWQVECWATTVTYYAQTASQCEGDKKEDKAVCQRGKRACCKSAQIASICWVYTRTNTPRSHQTMVQSTSRERGVRNTWGGCYGNQTTGSRISQKQRDRSRVGALSLRGVGSKTFRPDLTSWSGLFTWKNLVWIHWSSGSRCRSTADTVFRTFSQI